jgi:hypothetical protein
MGSPNSSTSSLRLSSLHSAISGSPTYQPNSQASSSPDLSSIENVAFGIVATVIGIAGLILAYAQVRKSGVADMISERIEHGIAYVVANAVHNSSANVTPRSLKYYSLHEERVDGYHSLRNDRDTCGNPDHWVINHREWRESNISIEVFA